MNSQIEQILLNLFRIKSGESEPTTLAIGNEPHVMSRSERTFYRFELKKGIFPFIFTNYYHQKEFLHVLIKEKFISKYSQTCAQRPPFGPEKHGRYAEGCQKNISGR